MEFSIFTAAAGCLLLLMLLLLLLHQRRSSRWMKEPQSVGCYPVLGSIWHLKEPWYLSLHEDFGDQGIVMMKFGAQKVYVLNRWAEFKEAMVDNADNLAGRPDQYISLFLFKDHGGLAMSEGTIWKEYRRFTLKTLRDFGLGRRGVEEIVLDETQRLLQQLEADQPVDTAAVLCCTISNVICQLVFGCRLASQEPRFAELLELLIGITQSSEMHLNDYLIVALKPLVQRLPFLAHLLVRTPAAKQIVSSFQQLAEYCQQQQLQHQRDSSHQPEDLIDAHLQLQRSDKSGIFNDTRLSLAVADLFIAGTDTTANTLRWALLYMLKWPHVAQQVRQEIRTQVGNRLVTWQDKKSLNFTQAVLEETHRMASLVPLGLTHRLVQNVQLRDFVLEKDALCIFNVYNIHMDAAIFPEPHEFRPERHLRDGNFTACEHLAAFGLGRRACLGESLARMELFLFFSNIITSFHFSLDPQADQSLENLVDNHGHFKGCLLRAPPHHKLVFSAID